MSFPEHIERVLNAYSVRADTKAALNAVRAARGEPPLAIGVGINSGVAVGSPSVSANAPGVDCQLVVREAGEGAHQVDACSLPSRDEVARLEVEASASERRPCGALSDTFAVAVSLGPIVTICSTVWPAWGCQTTSV